jgi:hypothetical protein
MSSPRGLKIIGPALGKRNPDGGQADVATMAEFNKSIYPENITQCSIHSSEPSCTCFLKSFGSYTNIYQSESKRLIMLKTTQQIGSNIIFTQ